MPIYEFRCTKCSETFEVIQKLSDKPPSKCQKCGGRLEKLFSAPAIQFKGEGWYITDYARKGNKTEKDGGGAGAAPAGEKNKSKETPSKKSGSDGD